MNVLDSFKELSNNDKLRCLKKWDEAYYVKDSPLISDEDYDLCVAFYNESTGKTYTSSLGKASNAFQKYKHETPVLSLAKITTKEEYDNYVTKYDYNVVIEPKLDGLTVVYYPDGKMVSRGDGYTGEVLPFANSIPNLPKPLDKPVRMEVFIKKSIYKTFFSDNKKNSRNVVAGILRRKEYTNDINFLSYRAYNILGEDYKTEIEQLVKLKLNGFDIVDFLSVKNKEKTDAAYSDLKNWVDLMDYPTDGIVIKYNGGNGFEKFGGTNHHPNNMVAYKFQSLVKSTILREIIWSQGRSKWTPVAKFDPVVLGDNTISAASVHNLNIINKFNLKIGAKIVVTLKNEIIPQIVSCDGNGTDIPIPEVCNVCGTTLRINDSQELYCPNSACSFKGFDTIMKMVSKQGLNFEGIGNKNLKKIFDYLQSKDRNDLFSFFKLTVKDLEEIGFTSYMAISMKTEIEKKVQNVELKNFLTAANIPGLGPGMAKVIANFYHNNYDEFIQNFESTGENIPNVGSVLYENIKAQLNFLSEFSKYVSFKETEEILVNEKAYNFTLTGTLSKPRKDIVRDIELSGHIFNSSLTKKTNYLIVGDKPSDSKIEKAKQNNIPIISEEELYNIIKNHE